MALRWSSEDSPIVSGVTAGPGPEFVILRGMQVANAPRRLHVGRWVTIALVAGFLALLAYGLTSKGTDDRIDEALASGRAATPPSFSLELLEQGTLPPRIERLMGNCARGRSPLARRAARRARRPEPVGLLVHALPAGGEGAGGRLAHARPEGRVVPGPRHPGRPRPGQEVHPGERHDLSECPGARAGSRGQLWGDRHPRDVLHRRTGPGGRPCPRAGDSRSAPGWPISCHYGASHDHQDQRQADGSEAG